MSKLNIRIAVIVLAAVLSTAGYAAAKGGGGGHGGGGHGGGGHVGGHHGGGHGGAHFWGGGFGAPFWGYGYDDIYAGMFAPYAYDDLAGYLPPRAAAPGTPDAAPDRLTQMCGDDSRDIAGLPIDLIQRAIEPTETQRAALDELAN